MSHARGDTSVSLLHRLHREFGRGSFSFDRFADLLPDRTPFERRELLSTLLRDCLVRRTGEGRYRLTTLATARVEHVDVEAPIEVIPEQPIDAVTRRFLEEVLAEARLPRELLDSIIFTYQIDGRLEMSEDGNRYIIRLGEHGSTNAKR